jgi:ATP-dependent Clp protease ATP-binding subunit ClpA
VSEAFDRCDGETVAVLDAGFEEARRLGHGWLGTEHLLLALVSRREVLPEPVAELLPAEADVRAALSRHVGEQPPLPQGELLATLGIDLDDVRAAVRRTFGAEAVERLRRPVHQPWQPWRRPSRACMSLLAGQMVLAARVKRALELAWEDAARRQRDAIDPAGLLLGMVEVEGLAARLLVDVGVPLDDVRVAIARAGL